MQINITTTDRGITEKLKSAPFESEVNISSSGMRTKIAGSPIEWVIGIAILKFTADIASKVIASWIYDNLVKGSNKAVIDGQPVASITDIEHVIEEKRTPKTTTRKEEMKIRIVRSK